MMHAFPLTAAVDAMHAATGLHAATVDTGVADGPAIFPGYLSRQEALAAGARFALQGFGRRPVMPADYTPAPASPAPALPVIRDACRDLAGAIADARETLAGVKSGRRGDNRRRRRETVRNANAEIAAVRPRWPQEGKLV